MFAASQVVSLGMHVTCIILRVWITSFCMKKKYAHLPYESGGLVKLFATPLWYCIANKMTYHSVTPRKFSPCTVACDSLDEICHGNLKLGPQMYGLDFPAKTAVSTSSECFATCYSGPTHS